MKQQLLACSRTGQKSSLCQKSSPKLHSFSLLANQRQLLIISQQQISHQSVSQSVSVSRSFRACLIASFPPSPRHVLNRLNLKRAYNLQKQLLRPGRHIISASRSSFSIVCESTVQLGNLSQQALKHFNPNNTNHFLAFFSEHCTSQPTRLTTFFLVQLKVRTAQQIYQENQAKHEANRADCVLARSSHAPPAKGKKPQLLAGRRAELCV